MLNLHRLRILREIANRGTITGAAKALWMTPPSISQHMAALESEAGVVLLERVGRRVRLTPAARKLVEHTERMLADMERAEADLALSREEVAGALHISAPPTAARSIVIPAMAELIDAYPALDITLYDTEQPDSLVELRSGNFDIAIGLEYTVSALTQETGLDVELLVSEPVYLAIPASHPLAAQPQVRLEQLSSERWFAACVPNPCREAVLRATAFCGFEPRIELLSSMDYQVMLAAVAAGLGVTLVPHIALYAEVPGVSLKPLVDVPLRRRIYAAMREGSRTSPPVAAALDAIKHAADKVAEDFRDESRAASA